MSWYFLDIETTMDHETIRLVGLKGTTNNWFCSDSHGLSDMLDNLQDGDTLFTYNGEGFDYPVLKNVWGIDVPELLEARGVKLMDLFIMSKLAFNDRESHSLDSWAKEIDPEFTKLTVDYDHAPIGDLTRYLIRDLEITEKVAKHIMTLVGKMQVKAKSKGKGFSFKHALKVETAVRRIMNEQREHGFPFDVEKAVTNQADMMDEMELLDRAVEHLMPSFPLPKSKLDHPPKIQFKKDGTLSAAMEKYLRRNDATYSEEFKCVHHKGTSYDLPLTQPLVTESRLSLGDQTRLKEWLIEQGWFPQEWNKDKDGNRTSPRLLNSETKEPDTTLTKFLDRRVVSYLAKYATLKSRVAQIGGPTSGLLSRVEMKGFNHVILHDADTLGTPTGRMRHKKVVNIPRPSSPYGREIRELFIPFDGRNMVGWDASSLEARMEAHYTYPFDPDYANELVTGDVHERNMKLLGLPDRDTAKKFKYMITYGARPPKIAHSLGVSLDQATDWYNDFWAKNKGLAMLMQYIREEWIALDKKYILGLDGRLLQTRTEHALLNTKLQGAGAIVMKHALLIAHKRITKELPGARALIRYHDEEQWSAAPGTEHIVGCYGVQSIVDAGRYLKLNVPLAGEYKVGYNWSETH